MGTTMRLASGRALSLTIAGVLFSCAGACSGSAAPGSGPVIANTAAPGAARVLLYGRPDVEDESRLALQPIACVLGGTLATAVACGEAMPPKARVKLVGGPVISIERSSRDIRRDSEGEGEQVYRAPRGPQCCSYHSCVGETILYFAPAGTAPAEGGVLAIWPDSADIGLTAYEPAHGAGERDGPPGLAVSHLVRAGRSALAAGRERGSERCLSCTQLLYSDGTGWRAVDRDAGPGPDGFHVMATSDLDRDGRAEAVVHEIWRNDYALMVLGNEWSKPLLRYSCGNI